MGDFIQEHSFLSQVLCLVNAATLLRSHIKKDILICMGSSKTLVFSLQNKLGPDLLDAYSVSYTIAGRR